MTKTGEPEQSKRLSQKSLDFYKRYSTKYRIAVLKIFIEFINLAETELGKPKRIIEEFYSSSSHSYDDIYERFYKKIENIKSGKSKGIDDPDLFILIESFVLKNCHESLAKISFKENIRILESALDIFFSGSISKILSGSEIISNNSMKSLDTLDSIDEKTLYKINFNPSKSINRHTSSEMNQYSDYNFYLAVKSRGDWSSQIAILFSDAEKTHLHFGTYSLKNKFVFMQHWKSSTPLFISFSLNSNKIIGLTDQFLVNSNMFFSENGFYDVDDFSDESEFHTSLYGSLIRIKKDKENHLIFSKANTIFSNFLSG
tara:strand:+ start:523 stop:1467 length:945 start_codon:yes stop_codon:yes gene_type:complete